MLQPRRKSIGLDEQGKRTKAPKTLLRVPIFLVVGIVRSLIRTRGCLNNNEDI